METPRSRRSVSSGTEPHDSSSTTNTPSARATFSAKVTPSVRPKRRRASTMDTVHYTQRTDSDTKSTPSRRSSSVLQSPVSRTAGRRVLKRSSLCPSSTNETPKRQLQSSSAEDLGFGKTSLTSPTTAPLTAKPTPRRIFRSSSRASDTRKPTKEEEFKDWYDLLDKIKESVGGQEAST